MAALLITSALALACSAAAQLQGRGFPDCDNGPLKDNTVCDTTADPLTRATALINAFTLQEKLNNTGSTSPGVPRLGLPAYTWWQEALHGVASSPGVNFSDSGPFRYATSFPQPILMGAAFDDDLIRDVATVISTEARAFNNDKRAGLDFWTPNINPFKDSRWGRGQETPGEDPYHLSSYVAALIEGLQGSPDDKYKRVVATCKHFVAYDMESWNGNFRYQFDAQVSSQDLVEYYMPPFQQCARDSNVGAFMCSYNALNGVPTCADPWLLQTVLREKWNWTSEQQWVTSDCDAVQNVFLPHDYASTREEAAALSLKAGTDINCGTYYQDHLPAAYDQGLINTTDLDISLIRQYSSLVRLGYFDGLAVPYRNLTWNDVSTPHAQQLAYKAAAEGITLLKNDGVLPLTISNGTSIALIGDWANATDQMLGNYDGIPPFFHSPLYAAQQTGATVNFATGPGGQGDPTTDHWLPVWAAANKSDVIIYAGGIDNSVESEGMDRVSLTWTGAQLDMIGQLAMYGKPVIVLQMGGGQIDSSPLVNNPNVSALIWGGYPGQDGGVALFDIIRGITAPAGRLPTTQYPAKYISQVPMTDMTLRPNSTTGSPGRTYIWYNENAVFPYGLGLHYTNFTAAIKPSFPSTYDSSSSNSGSASYDISTLTSNCTATYKDLCPFTSFSVSITNTGEIMSDYVTLGFLAGIHGPAPHPNKRLVSYQRLHNITAGSSQTAWLNLTLGSLARVDEMGNKVLYPGDYALLVDTQPLAMGNFTLTGTELMLDEWPQAPASRSRSGSRPTDYFVGGYGSEQIMG
ncbi:glycoside hydrolase family 3 protein [Dothistroma septosporum NZE10]|uniref:xylan 1,4-beta-xylosidase n=1 Tax=Dothistroma septosporum (strain NZE10 / CBS 128990) TaxID=675120 RepID=N1Q2P3_DOTSN|nr:glycoside hydrolase family 3 protein [Dothistroma septosporum NZE10]